MRKISKLIGDPIWQGAAAIIAIVVSFFSIFDLSKKCEEPIYEFVIDGSLCGTTSEEYIIAPATPKTCRLKDFGRESWSSTEVVDLSSGWVDGGSSKDDWCESVKSAFIQSRSITNEYLVDVQNKNEEAKWTLDRKRLYKYSCKVKFSWNPIYLERQDNLCGTTPVEVGYKEVAKECQKKIATKLVECEV